MEWLDWVNPLSYLSEEEYLRWWNALAHRYLEGVPLRLLTVGFLSGCYWCGVYRQRVGLAIVFFLLTLLTAYVHPLMHVLGLV
ncbi:MAG: hypothetical protein ABL983_09895 [Nitrospira sp.]